MGCKVRYRMTRSTSIWITIILMMVMTKLMICEAMMFSPRDPCEADGCRCTDLGAFCECDRNVKTLSLRGSQTPYIRTLSIRGCRHVHIAENTLRNMTMLSRVEIRDVQELVLDRMSMHGGHRQKNLEITITNSTIENLTSYVFQGNISQILLKNCRIKLISPYAFSSLTSPNIYIIILNSTIDSVSQQAFKRIQLLNFHFIQSEILTDVPSKILSEVEILENFLIKNSTFKTVKSSAFHVMYPRTVDILNSKFGAIEGDAFMMTVRGEVRFENNVVDDLQKGAFAGITVTKDTRQIYGPRDFMFENNTILQFNQGSFWTNESSIKPRYSNIQLQQPCSCKLVDIVPFTTPVFCTVESRSGKETTYRSLDKVLALECKNVNSNAWYIWLILVICLLLLLVGGGFMIWWCKRLRNRNQKKWVNNADEKNPNIIMPEPKTYRETELHVIVERAELLTTDL